MTQKDLAPTSPAVSEVAATAADVLAAVGTAVVGQERSLRLALAAVLSGGHVLVEDVPGTGKTLAARSLASALGLDFRRLQCTPDLLPADVTGSFVYDPNGAEFVFHPGPVMTGLLLADEINRTPPKTQSALLEAMQEGQVTVEGRTLRPAPAVPRARDRQPDRVRGHLPAAGGPARPVPAAARLRLPHRRGRAGRRAPPARPPPGGRPPCRPWSTPWACARLQAGVEQVDVDPDVVTYAVALTRATREHSQVEVGASPRGSLALVLVARSLAVLDGRDVVLPEDVKECAVAVLAHRLTLAPETWSTGLRAVDVVTDLLGRVPTPPTRREA